MTTEPQDRVAQVASLSEAQRRTLLAMTDEWLFSGAGTFNWPGAWSLLRHRINGEQLCEMSGQRYGRRGFRDAFRLTPLGLALRNHLSTLKGVDQP